MTPSGIEPATFRFVAQHLNHCATAVPFLVLYQLVYMFITRLKVLVNERTTRRLVYFVKIIDLLVATVGSTHVTRKKRLS